MFVEEFSGEHLGIGLISCRRELEVQQAVRTGINSNVQSEPFVIEMNHGLVNRDVIRVRTVVGL
jgi:hypothetical protein